MKDEKLSSRNVHYVRIAEGTPTMKDRIDEKIQKLSSRNVRHVRSYICFYLRRRNLNHLSDQELEDLILLADRELEHIPEKLVDAGSKIWYDKQDKPGS